MKHDKTVSFCNTILYYTLKWHLIYFADPQPSEHVVTLTGTISFVICLYLAVWVPLGVAFDGGNTAAILCPSLAALFFVGISLHHGMISFNGRFFQGQLDLVARKSDFVCKQTTK